MGIKIPSIGSIWNTFATTETFKVKYADDKIVIAVSSDGLEARVPWERWTEWFKRLDKDDGAVPIG